MDDNFGADALEPTDNLSQDKTYYMHNFMVLTHAGKDDEIYTLPPLAEINPKKPQKPLSPPFTPLPSIPLPDPEYYRVLIPQAVENHPPLFAHDPVISGERIEFPVAPTPIFQQQGMGTTPTAISSMPTHDVDHAGIAPPVDIVDSGDIQQAEFDTEEPVAYRVDPMFPFLLFIALGVGTLYMNMDVISRYTVLWSLLIILGGFFVLLDGDNQPQVSNIAGIGWGFSFGIVFSLPLLILVSSGFAQLSAVLFPDTSAAMRFQMLAIIAPLAETLTFRGAFQNRRNLITGVFGAAITGILLYWPVALTAPSYLIAAGIFTMVLAGVYGFVRLQYGLAAAFICQLTVNLTLLFLPGIIG